MRDEEQVARTPRALAGELPADLAIPARLPGAATRRMIFATVSVALFMSAMDQTIVATALPTLHRALHAPLNWTGWTITAYSLGQVVALPLSGRVSDQFGRRRIFLASTIAFSVASLACGLSTNVYMLIALRALQGAGGAGIIPSASGIVADHFGEDRDRAVGMFTSIYPLGAMAGPVFGGLLVTYVSWRAIFFVNVPLGVLVVALVLRLVPVSVRRDSGRVDVVGVVVLGVLILAAMLGVTSLGNAHSSALSATVLVPIAIAVLLGVSFVRHTLRAAQPIIPLRLLRQRGFYAANFVVIVFGASALGFASLVPLFAQVRYHMTSLQSGTLLTARAIGSGLVAGITSYLLRRIGYRIPILVGFATMALSQVMIVLSPHLISTYAWLAVASTVLGIGAGIAAPATNNAMLSQAPDDIAAISGLRQMFRQMGGIIAISIATTVVVRSGNEGLALTHTFLAFAVLVVAAMPVILAVPEHRGTW